MRVVATVWNKMHEIYTASYIYAHLLRSYDLQQQKQQLLDH